MPKKYVLTKSYLSRDNLNRLVKQITDNAKEDRAEVLSLLTDIKERLNTADPEQPIAVSELIKSATAALKQIQEVNGTLIKVMGIIQDDISDTKPKNIKDKETPILDLFEGLDKLTGVKNDKEE